MQEAIGFIGLGHMGFPMAKRLLRANIPLAVYDLQKGKMEAAQSLGAYGAASLEEVVSKASIIITMVPDDTALESIVSPILERLEPGGIHLSMSTISPTLARQLAKRYERSGGRYFLSGAVLGRPDLVADGAATILVSGSSPAREQVTPLLRVLGRQVTDLGEQPTAAPTFKLCTNFLVLAAIEAMGEAADLVGRWGGDRVRFLRMTVDLLPRVYQVYGEMIVKGEYGNALFPVSMGLKDAGLMLSAAQEVELDLPLAKVAARHLQRAADAGAGSQDWSVVTAFTYELGKEY